ncbi:hypothetical protein ACQEV2_42820 [Streptomyces sp. CA-251387]|uniref:hypothetical protein n=1 Tax=Streptomyces sp. CA-251387 TaxID=3240064 RepID=UPI003D8B01E5
MILVELPSKEASGAIALEASELYRRRSAFLPIDAVPRLSPELLREGRPGIAGVRAHLTEGAHAAQTIVQKLSQVPLAPFITSGYIAGLRAYATRGAALLEDELADLNAHHNDDTSAEAVRCCVTGDELLLLGHTLQDRYFGIRRVPDITWGQLAAQVCSTAEAVLIDLPFTCIDFDETIAITNALSHAWGILGNEPPKEQATISQPLTVNGSVEQIWRQAWSWSSETESFARTVAEYRWITGHHFLNLCFLFCRSALRRATEEMGRQKVERAAKAVDQATVFLRGTTAAMRYAGNFPAHIYNTFTRPSMDKVGRAHPFGFSGTQNWDYAAFRSTMQALTAEVEENRGPLREPDYAQLLKALQVFRETYLADMEQHVLIAASKVSTDASLMQKAARRGMPSSCSMKEKSGTEILRDLAALRREELNW